jgi:predicted Fe-S protein YdhL (DUF1289 family)
MAYQSRRISMKDPIAAIVAALLMWGVAAAQTGPPAAGAPASPQAAMPPDAAGDIWSRMTPEQRKQLWQQLTPEERATIWRRLPPEQRKAIRERLTPQRGDRPPGPGQFTEPRPGPKLSPEERRRLREDIQEAHPFRRGRLGRP